MTKRDVYILSAVALAGLVAAYWLLLLGPKRSDLSRLDRGVAKAEKSLREAEQEKLQNAQARLQFPRAYANVVRLGKSVPVDDDEASLVFQLDRAAGRAGVSFRSLKLESSGGESGSSGATTTTPPPPSDDSGGEEQGGEGEQAAEGGEGGGGDTKSGAQADSGTASEPFGSASATDLIGTAPADALATATVSTGASTGAAGLRVMHFELNFQGSFFRLEDFLHELKRMVVVRKGELRVSGRLVAVDAIKFAEGDRGFPQVKATITATTYLLPLGEGLAAGATPDGPAGATDSTPQAASSSDTSGAAPPAATATTP